MKELRYWLNSALPPQRELLAKYAKTSLKYLWHLAGGQRKASAEMAAKIEAASDRVSRTGMYRLKRGEISKTCAKCPFYLHSCKGEK